MSRICIIGAGAAGLAILKEITHSEEYKNGLWKVVDCFEERQDVGGIWLPSASSSVHPPFTPLYDSLTTNLPHPIMSFRGFTYPQATPLFPPASTVETYLRCYTESYDLRKHIHFSKAVIHLNWCLQSSDWAVRLSTSAVHHYDRIVVSNGHHRIPRYPSTSGLEVWLSCGKALHSIYFRHAPSDQSKLNRVYLVVGAGPSGSDISAELVNAGCKTVYRSVTGGEAALATSSDLGDNPQIKGRVVSFSNDPGTGEVTFADGSSVSGVDFVILATGYQLSLPFLSAELVTNGISAPSPPLPSTLHNSTYHLFPLARQIWPIAKNEASMNVYPVGSIAFMGLCVRVSPMPLCEAQAKAITAVFRNPAILTNNIELERRMVITKYESLRAELGQDILVAKRWHVFDEDQSSATTMRVFSQSQFDYRDDLMTLAGYSDNTSRVPQWVKEAYKNKAVLRQKWRALERSGKSEEWLRGVGKDGIEDWVMLMEKLMCTEV